MAEQNKNNEDKPIFSWKAAEFAVYQKDTKWFLLLMVVAILLIAFFVWNKNWTAVGVVVAGVFAFISLNGVKPKKISCKVYRDGVVIEDKAYRYTDLKSFWLIPGDHPRVRFARPGRFSPAINMPIDEEDPEQIRLFLSKYLPEEEGNGEDIADTISRWMKF